MTNKPDGTIDAAQLAANVQSQIREYSGIPEAADVDYILEFFAQHNWTREGAEEIEHVARRYGTFFLSNALALAAVLGIEDGDANF